MSSTTGTTTSTPGEFDVESFEQKLTNLKDTQDGIQQMSAWCLQQRTYHKKIVNSWLNVLKQVRVEHRLTLFYLANDVIQYSKRKNYEFVESWGTALQKATTMVRDEKVRNKIFRIFKIWEQREIYSEEYLSDLNGLLSMNPVKKTQQATLESSDDFQNTALISNIRECVRLEKCTDKNFKNLPKAPNCDIEAIKNNLKDRSHSDDAEKDIDDFVTALEAYIKSLKNEIRSRKSLINQIVQADTFYTNQRGEVKVVVNAYRNFGNRIKLVKKKLEEITPNLPSPIPSPDINAPSPEQDADIVLPDESSNLSINMFKNSSNGYSSYMDGNLPFDINDFKRESPKKPAYDVSSTGTQQIQVINNRSEQKSDASYNLNDFFKPNDGPYTPLDSPVPVAPVSTYALGQPTTGGSYTNNSMVRSGGYPNSSAPYNSGYDDSSYGTSTSSSYETQMPLMPPPMPPLLGVAPDDFNSTWDMDMSWTSINSNNSFNPSSIDTPVSPPHFEREGINSNLVEYMERGVNDEISSLQDVDHRQLHIPSASSGKMSLGKEKGRMVDVDHRNLISLTGSPGPGPRSFENKKKSNSPTRWQDKDNRLNMSSNVGGGHFHKQSEIDVDYRRQISSGDIDYRTTSNIQDFNKLQQGRPQFLQELPKETKSTNLKGASSAKENSSESARETTANNKKITNTVKQSEKLENQNLLSEPPPPGTLHPPPPMPPLDAFGNMNTFLSPPPGFSSQSSLEEFQTKDDNMNNAPVVIKKNKDNVESIDMDMSDDDPEDFFNRENLQQLEHLIDSTENDETTENQSAIIPIQAIQRPPLLQTPDIQISSWTHSMPDPNDMNDEMSMMWKTRMLSTPQFRVPGQPYIRAPFIQSPRGGIGFKQNFRDQGYGIPRNPPYFNNRGNHRFANRSRPRGVFRGTNKWQ